MFYKRFILPENGYVNPGISLEKAFDAVLEKELRLPFPRVFCEFTTENYWNDEEYLSKQYHTLALAEQSVRLEQYGLPVDVILVQLIASRKGIGWVRFPDIWVPRMNALTGKISEKKYSANYRWDKSWTKERSPEDAASLISHCVKNLFGFVEQFNRRDIVVTKIKNHSKKKSHGTKPYDDYWIIEVPKPRYVHRESLGGTHASPREHERAGHWRDQRTKNGIKRIFIEKITVNKGIGKRIEKDYELIPKPTDDL
jgi:hypothetical protein